MQPQSSGASHFIDLAPCIDRFSFCCSCHFMMTAYHWRHQAVECQQLKPSMSSPRVSMCFLHLGRAPSPTFNMQCPLDKLKSFSSHQQVHAAALSRRLHCHCLQGRLTHFGRVGMTVAALVNVGGRGSEPQGHAHPHLAYEPSHLGSVSALPKGQGIRLVWL